MASFPYFNGTASVHVCIRRSTKYSVPLKYGKVATKYRGYTDIFTVYTRQTNGRTNSTPVKKAEVMKVTFRSLIWLSQQVRTDECSVEIADLWNV